MTEVTFKNRKPNIEKLLSFGFEPVEGGYVHHAALVDGQLMLTVKVTAGEKIYEEITDQNSGEEYVLHRVAGARGSFVGQVKTEYEEILEKISAKCFDAEVFKSEQAKAVIAYVRDSYTDEVEYLWKKFPDNAIVRRKDNRKWYAALLTVSKKKLGWDSDDPIEILDVRMRPEDIEKRVDNKTCFSGYHMNKRHWVPVCLARSVAFDKICEWIDESYRLAGV